MTAEQRLKWVDVIGKSVQTMKVGAMIKQSVVFDHEGADALAKLMMDMAEKLDLAVEMVEEQNRVVLRQYEQLALYRKILKETDSLSGWLLWQWAGIKARA